MLYVLVLIYVLVLTLAQLGLYLVTTDDHQLPPKSPELLASSPVPAAATCASNGCSLDTRDSPESPKQSGGGAEGSASSHPLRRSPMPGIPMRGTSYGRALDLRYGATGDVLEIYVTFFGFDGHAEDSLCVSPLALPVDVDLVDHLLHIDSPRLELF